MAERCWFHLQLRPQNPLYRILIFTLCDFFDKVAEWIYLKMFLGCRFFRHLYMIPLVFIVGMFVGYNMRGTLDDEDETNKPPRPKID
jgi:hypothetical protein